ncbi:MAG: flavodoxin domain-containing protein [Anaerolinea sp.]|nr:flavodoxin domain-containing protein [Anaerolinea sp.]
MTDSVLVAYASPGGSTREVAEAVAEVLRSRGLRVDVTPMEQVKSAADYNAVVLGAPIYNTLWHQTALKFVADQISALVSRPVAIFALGPVQKGAPQEFTNAGKQLEISLRRFPTLKPVDLQIFGGKMKATDSGFPLNLLFKPTPAVDFRDWDTIRAWANSLPDVLQIARS